MSDKEQAVSLLGFEYSALIDDISKKSVGFQSTIHKDCAQEDIDGLLDKCRIAADRQRTFAKIEALEIDILNIKENITRALGEVTREDKEHSRKADDHPGRSGLTLNAAQQTARKQKIDAIESARMNIESLKDRVDILKAKLASTSQVAFKEEDGRETP